jgi:predicted metal-dependent hydrolase
MVNLSLLFRRTRRASKRRTLTPDERRTRRDARARIVDRVQFWAAEMQIVPNRVAVKDTRSRWGSASSLGNVNFNWRIAFMPDDVFDYVVIHELAHLREMNHSPAFWAIVAAYSPTYREHRRFLRKLGSNTKVTLV